MEVCFRNEPLAVTTIVTNCFELLSESEDIRRFLRQYGHSSKVLPLYHSLIAKNATSLQVSYQGGERDKVKGRAASGV